MVCNFELLKGKQNTYPKFRYHSTLVNSANLTLFRLGFLRVAQLVGGGGGGGGAAESARGL